MHHVNIRHFISTYHCLLELEFPSSNWQNQLMTWTMFSFYRCCWLEFVFLAIVMANGGSMSEYFFLGLYKPDDEKCWFSWRTAIVMIHWHVWDKRNVDCTVKKPKRKRQRNWDALLAHMQQIDFFTVSASNKHSEHNIETNFDDLVLHDFRKRWKSGTFWSFRLPSPLNTANIAQ